jgi:hypothetical protein
LLHATTKVYSVKMYSENISPGADSLGYPQKGVAVIGWVFGPANDPAGFFARDQPIAVEFNFVDPLPARARRRREPRAGRLDEPGRRRAPRTR